MAFLRNASFHATSVRWGLTLVAALALTACGGGGSGNGSSTVTVPVADTAALVPSVDTSTTPSHFAVHVGAPKSQAGLTYLLTIVDTTTSKVATPDFEAASYTVRNRYTVNASAGTATNIGPGYLYYLDANGSLFKRDLSGTTLGAAQQLSSLAGICSFNMMDLAPDGKHAWIRANHCTDGQDYLVGSNMSATDQALSGIHALRALTNTQKISTGILVSDTNDTRLAVYSNDLARVLYVVKSTVASTELPLAFLSLSPTSAQKGYLQTGTTVQALDWSAGTLASITPLTGSLPAAAATNGITVANNVTKDSSDVYVAVGNGVYSLSGAGDGISLKGNANPALGDIYKVLSTDSSWVVFQDSGGKAGTYTVSLINKSTQQLTPRTGLYADNNTFPDPGQSALLAIDGDTLYTAEPISTDPTGATYNIVSTVAATGVGTTLSLPNPVVNLYGVFKSTVVTLQGAQPLYLMWSSIDAGGAETFYSYSITNKALLASSLGVLGPEYNTAMAIYDANGVVISSLPADYFDNGVASSANVIATDYTPPGATAPTSVVYWTFDVTAAGSLAPVAP